MKNKYLIILVSFLTIAYSSVAQNTVYFNGLGRALVTSDRIGGSLYDSTSTQGAGGATPNLINGTQKLAPDTGSAKRGTSGYTIFDLGINAQPNETLRASAIFRIKNQFGGFYGDGSFFYFRQLRLDGIISKVVKYEIGDIDVGLTPYTLYNFDESYHDYEADIFGIRRSVVNYENFNFGNKWRMQGASGSTSLKFNKIIEKINIKAFATRNRTTDYLTIPDRLFFGGRIDAVQSKYFQLGANLARMTDLPQTSPSTQGSLYNNVVTGDYKITLPVGEKAGIDLNGEFGQSYFSFDTLSQGINGGVQTNTVKKGGFYDLGIAVKHTPLNIKLFANYRAVSADYLSPGAQTRRIYDFGYATYSGNGSIASYNNLTQLYPTYNNGTNYRTPGLYDRFTQENDRNLSLQTQLMPFLPQYNNITPYGIATPNRKGFTFGISAGESDKLIKADLIIDKLSEISALPNASSQLRKFTGVKGGLSLNLAKLLKTERLITVSGGFRYEHTTRSGDTSTAAAAAPIDLKSTLIDLGFCVEIVKNLDIIAGYKSMYAKGNEILTIRDASNNVVAYESLGQYAAPGGTLSTVYNLNPGFDVKQSIYAFGFRYRFTKNTYFTTQGNFVNYFDDSQSYADYRIKQLFLNYTMVF